MVGAEVCRRDAVADVVVLIGVFEGVGRRRDGVIAPYRAGGRDAHAEADSMKWRFHCAILYQIHLRNASARDTLRRRDCKLASVNGEECLLTGDWRLVPYMGETLSIHGGFGFPTREDRICGSAERLAPPWRATRLIWTSYNSNGQ